MKVNNFEEMLGWQKARAFTVVIYSRLQSCRDFGFKDQIQRAAVSICSNIAEGFERNSNKELRQFLYIAKGSAGEVRSLLYNARDLKYITEDNFQKDKLAITEISKILSAFIKTL